MLLCSSRRSVGFFSFSLPLSLPLCVYACECVGVRAFLSLSLFVGWSLYQSYNAVVMVYMGLWAICVLDPSKAMIPLLADRGRSEMMGRLLACLQVQDCFAYLCLMVFCILPHCRENSTSVAAAAAAAAASTHLPTHPPTHYAMCSAISLMSNSSLGDDGIHCCFVATAHLCCSWSADSRTWVSAADLCCPQKKKNKQKPPTLFDKEKSLSMMILASSLQEWFLT